MQLKQDGDVACLGPNTAGHDYVVGDIHGHVDSLSRLLAHVGFDDTRDRLFSVGDLIDRGPDSAEALGLTAYPWFHAIRGNHEQMMLDAVGGPREDRGARALWRMNGGLWFDSTPGQVGARLIEQARGLPLALCIEQPDRSRVGIVHAEVPGADWPAFIAALEDDEPTRASAAEAALWSRDQAMPVRQAAVGATARGAAGARSVAGIDQVFHGHTPMPAPIESGNRYWLDTGVFLPEGGLSLARLGATPSVVCQRHEARDVIHGWQSVNA